jgi:sugar lactone lactonase YvrE
VCVGLTGSISRYWHGRQQLVVQGLPSYAPFAPPSAGAVGPSDVSFAAGRGYVVIGLAANPDVRAQLAEPFGWVARFHANGRVTYTIDVSAHETQANPDGGLVESNPNGLLADAGPRVVADAAANSLLSLDRLGQVSTIAVFPSRPQGRSTDAVPTSVARGPDGALYVGELTGVPFTPGQAAIWRLAPGQPPQLYCTGFSYIIDLDVDRHGRLYVLEHASAANGPFAGTPGQLLRVAPDCTRKPIRTGLPAPTSVAIGPDGNPYISINGTSATAGEVIRVELGRHATPLEPDAG